jgi:hypothetical protein
MPAAIVCALNPSFALRRIVACCFRGILFSFGRRLSTSGVGNACIRCADAQEDARRRQATLGAAKPGEWRKDTAEVGRGTAEVGSVSRRRDAIDRRR